MNNFKLPARTKNILIRKYPNKISRENKIKIAEDFFYLYKKQLSSKILKNTDKSFREINRDTLISLMDQKTSFNNQYFKYIKEKDIYKIEKSIEDSILKFKIIYINEDVSLNIKNKEIFIIQE